MPDGERIARLETEMHNHADRATRIESELDQISTQIDRLARLVYIGVGGVLMISLLATVLSVLDRLIQ